MLIIKICIIIPAEGRIAFDSTEDLRFQISSRYIYIRRIWKSQGSPLKSTHLAPPPRPNKVTPSFLWIRFIGKKRSHHPISIFSGWKKSDQNAKSAIYPDIRYSDMVIISIWKLFWELQRLSVVALQPPWVLCIEIITIHCIFISIRYQNNRSMTMNYSQIKHSTYLLFMFGIQLLLQPPCLLEYCVLQLSGQWPL